MTELQASRTLVKSPPELWAECSDAASLARHLDGFGEIRITRLEPETAVAWEGERASGTVRIEPAGWGTKVVLTAKADVAEPEAPPPPAPPEPEPAVAETPAQEPPPPERKRRFARLRAYWRGERVAVPEPAPPADDTPEPAPEAPAPADDPPEPVPEASAPAPEAPTSEPSETEAALAAALDSLGQAHHRPYSRA